MHAFLTLLFKLGHRCSMGFRSEEVERHSQFNELTKFGLNLFCTICFIVFFSNTSTKIIISVTKLYSVMNIND
ncbi:hypothetical protein C0J52_08735 [Blattella germanica]|nr:hypothetical protein C0J52_08735 [Blattella germanica]